MTADDPDAQAVTDDDLPAPPMPGAGADLLTRGDRAAGEGRFDLAMPDYMAALADPDLKAGAASRIAAVAMLQEGYGRPQSALDTFDRLLELAPEAVDARFRRGLLRLQLRDFAGGWPDYEARWDSAQFLANSRGLVPAAMVADLATGVCAADLAGKRVLVVGEQGIGDELMFASIIPDLAAAAASVTLVCEPRLARLFAASFPGVSVLTPQDAQVDSGAVDVLLPIGGLGHAFRRTEAAFGRAPYARPRPEVLLRWSGRVGPRDGRLRIGLAWRGGTPATRGEARSLSLEQLAPLLSLPGCEIVSLQHDARGTELAMAEALGVPLRTFPGTDLHDFEDQAGLMLNLDLVVSVQTATVHLAGALGLPCLALVQHQPEWRYMLEGETMPWYGSVRLLRQPAAGDWATPIARAMALVGERIAGAAP